jgi:hypothetical protein
MASLTERIRTFMNTPRGQRLAEQGRRQLAKPENQRRLRSLLARLQGKGRRP